MKKLLGVLSAAILVAGSVSSAVACNAGGGDKTIGFIVSAKNNPYFANMLVAANKEASAKGYTLHEYDSSTAANASGDTAQEQKNITNALNSGDKAIILNPVDSNNSTGAKMVEDNKVPLFTVDRGYKEKGFTESIYATDSVAASSSMFDAVKKYEDANRAKPVDETNKLQVYELWGPTNTDAAQDRDKGFMGNHSKLVNLVTTDRQIADFSLPEAADLVSKNIDNVIKADVIFSQNDEMAMGAIQALKGSDQGKAWLNAKGHIVVGFDAEEPALAQIKAWNTDKLNMYGTVQQQPDQMAKMSVDEAISYIENNTSLTHTDKLTNVSVNIITGDAKE